MGEEVELNLVNVHSVWISLRPYCILFTKDQLEVYQSMSQSALYEKQIAIAREGIYLVWKSLRALPPVTSLSSPQRTAPIRTPTRTGNPSANIEIWNVKCASEWGMSVQVRWKSACMCAIEVSVCVRRMNMSIYGCVCVWVWGISVRVCFFICDFCLCWNERMYLDLRSDIFWVVFHRGCLFLMSHCWQSTYFTSTGSALSTAIALQRL